MEYQKEDVDFLGHRASSLRSLQFIELTTAERDAIISPKAGTIIFNTTTDALNHYTGEEWVSGFITEDTADPVGQPDGYFSVVGDTLWYFTGGNRYKLTATLDNAAPGAGMPIGAGPYGFWTYPS